MAMAEKQTTYCSLDGAPAVLVRMPDGRVFGYLFTGGAWQDGHDLEIVQDGRVMSKDDFDGTFPDVPDEPAPQ